MLTGNVIDSGPGTPVCEPGGSPRAQQAWTLASCRRQCARGPCPLPETPVVLTTDSHRDRMLAQGQATVCPLGHPHTGRLTAQWHLLEPGPAKHPALSEHLTGDTVSVGDSN